MAISNSGLLSGRTSSEQPTYERKPPMRNGLRQLAVLELDEVEETSYDDKTQKVTKIRFTFVVVTPGEDYGRYVWYSVTPTISPPREGAKESNLHKLLSALTNNAEPLSSEQIAAYRRNPTELNSLVGAQLLGFIKVNASGTGNKLDSYMPAPSQLPAYVAPVKELDPRNAGEDEAVVCATPGCGRIIRGFEGKEGWVSQEDLVASSTEKYGEVLCGKHIRARKAGELPF